MRKTIAAIAAGLAMGAVVGPLGSAAHAADCYGVMSFDDTYVCVVRVENPNVVLVPGPAFLVPAVCLGQLGCTEEQWVFTPDALVDAGTVVLFYNGECIYLEDGEQSSVPAESADDCP